MNRRTVWLLVKSSAVLYTGCLLSACAFGRNETTGEIVGGFSLGVMADTANQALGAGLAAATGIPGIGSIAVGALGILGTAFGAKKMAEKKAEDRGWEEAQKTYSPPPGTVVVAPSATLPPIQPAPVVPAPAGATQ